MYSISDRIRAQSLAFEHSGYVIVIVGSRGAEDIYSYSYDRGADEMLPNLLRCAACVLFRGAPDRCFRGVYGLWELYSTLADHFSGFPFLSLERSSMW